MNITNRYGEEGIQNNNDVIKNNKIMNEYLDNIETINKLRRPMQCIYVNIFLSMTTLIFLIILCYDFYKIKTQLDESLTNVNDLIMQGRTFLNEGMVMIPEVKHTINNISSVLKEFKRISDVLTIP